VRPSASDDPVLVLVDADDTLWENNRYFLAVIDAWVGWVGARGVAAATALAVLEGCEDRNIPLRGYGAAPFVASLREAFCELLPGAGAAERSGFEEFARREEAGIRDHEIVLLPGVADAVAALAPRVPLVLFTKGRDDEQRAKFARSGLASAFADVRVVAEKRAEVYAEECARRGIPPDRAWMVGNSPRSDVNPARRAGLRTVLVPHDAPWHRELEPLAPEGRHPVLVASSFADVPRLVAPGRRDAAPTS
jgi:putative hydrolase of the HAD superfamily